MVSAAVRGQQQREASQFWISSGIPTRLNPLWHTLPGPGAKFVAGEPFPVLISDVCTVGGSAVSGGTDLVCHSR